MHHLTAFEQVCAIGGDSGGPVFIGSTALGLFSSGNINETTECHRRGTYVEITEADAAMGVHVGAPQAAAPVAETGVASEVRGREATGNGSVDANGATTSYYFDYGTTTAYGNATPNWSAGSQWQAIPVAGQMVNLRP